MFLMEAKRPMVYIVSVVKNSVVIAERQFTSFRKMEDYCDAIENSCGGATTITISQMRKTGLQ